MVLEIEHANKSVKPLAFHPTPNSQLQKVLFDGLYFSPIRDAIEHDIMIDEQKIVQTSPRFKNFFPLLPFKACYGVPLRLSGMPLKHLLLLMHEHKNAFSLEEKQQAQLLSMSIQTALERNELFDYMRRFEQRYTLGQLLNSLVHELNTKIGTFDQTLYYLSSVLDEALSHKNLQAMREEIATSIDVLEDLEQTKSEMKALTEGIGDKLSRFRNSQVHLFN